MTPAGTRTRSRSRRPAIYPGRRFALSLALALGAAMLLWPATVALAASSAPFVQVTLYRPGVPSVIESLTVDQVQDNVSGDCAVSPQAGMDLAELEPDGVQSPVDPNPDSTWDLATILADCGLSTPIPAGEIRGITVFNNGAPEYGPGSQLTQGDLTRPTDFANTGQMPIVWLHGGAAASSVEYDRPSRNGSDVNGADIVTQTTGTPLQFAVYTGPLLTVTVNASSTSPSAGATVSFTASVGSDPASPTYSYDWNVTGDATLSASGSASPTVTFPAAGVYTVSAQVTGSDGSGGVGSATVTVGSLPATTAPTSTGPASPTSSATPTPASGHTPKGKGQGKGTGTSTAAAPGASTGEHRGAGSTTTSPHTATSGSTTSAGTTTTPNVGSGSGSGSGASGSASTGSGSIGSGAGDGTVTPTPTIPPATTTPASPRSPKPAPTHVAPTPAPTQDGVVVTGHLIADVDPVPAGSSPLVATVAAPGAGAIASGARHASSSSPWAIIGSLLAVIALLCLGAGRELRVRIDWRTLRPQRPR